MGMSSTDRNIRVEKSAVGSAIVSGDGNTIYVIHQNTESEQTQLPNITKIGKNPYKGLSAFQSQDTENYFGREPQIKRIWKRLERIFTQSSEHLRRGKKFVPRFLSVLGPSGSGKSSLIRAGLIPELARKPLPGAENLQVVVMVPGMQPLETLAGVLAKAATRDPLPIEKAQEFERALKTRNEVGEYDGLRRIALMMSDIHQVPLLIIVDQLEETFSLCKDGAQREVFISTLVHASSDPMGAVSVVVTLRSDFWGETQKYESLNQLVCSDRSVNVPAMTVAELRRAISEPARRAGYPLDDATVDLLVRDTEGREGALPLLQFALTQIWEGLRRGKLSIETYRNMGGVGGALASRAQQIYDGLGEIEKEITSRLFVGLVQLGEGVRDTRRRVPVANLITNQDTAVYFQHVLASFSLPEARLILLSSESGKTTVEITHEALFEHWKLLKEWLDNNRDKIRYQRWLDEHASYWNELGRPSGLLWRRRSLDVIRDVVDTAWRNKTQLSQTFFELSEQAEEKAEKRGKANRSLRYVNISGFIASFTIAILAYIFVGKSVEKVAVMRMALYAARAESLAISEDERLIYSLAAINIQSSTSMPVPSSYGKIDVSTALLEKSRIIQDTYTKLDFGEVASILPNDSFDVIATGMKDGKVQVWNREGELISTSPKGHTDWVKSLAISSDGKFVVTGGLDGTVQLWDRDQKSIRQLSERHTGAITSVAISSDGQTIVAGSADATVRIWDRQGMLKDTVLLPRTLFRETAATPSASISETSSSEQRRSFWVTSVAVDKNGQIVAASSRNGIMQMIDYRTTPKRILPRFSREVDSVIIAEQIIAASGQQAKLWDLQGNPTETFSVENNSSPTTLLSISSDGKRLATADENGSIWLWDCKGRLIGNSLEISTDTPIISLALGSDKQGLFVGTGDGSVRILPLALFEQGWISHACSHLRGDLSGSYSLEVTKVVVQEARQICNRG